MSDYPMLISNKLHSFRNFVTQSYTNRILRKIPSKRGGGLWNLAKDTFHIEDTCTNRKLIERQFNLAYNPVPKHDKFK